MTLLAPAALFGLALLAIPVVVHLFKPRHVRQTPFSSLRWLHLTQQRMARRIQWHQVILFLLRAGFLTLIVFALARPIWSPAGTAAGLNRIVVLDVSRSMGRIVEGRPTPWETARDAASQLICDTLPGDRTAVLLTGNKTDVLAPWTNDAVLYLPSLSALQLEPTETQLDSAFEPIRSLLAQRRAGARVEIVFLTDNPANGWNKNEISAFAQELKEQPDIALRLIDVGLPAPRNAWLSAARLRTKNAETVLHVEASSTGDAALQRTLRVSGLSGVEPQDFPVTLQPGRRTTLDLPLPSTFNRSGSLATLRLEPADELPDDDVFFLDLDSSGASRMLLITPNAPADAAQRPALALETAIRSLAETGSVAAEGQLVMRTPVTLSAQDVAAADVILLADVPGLNEALSSAIADRVRSGAGLAVFLGPAVEPEAYNRSFVQPLSPAQSLLPSELAGSVQADAKQGGLSPWKNWNDRHPLLSGLVDPEVGDLAGTESRTWYRFRNPLTASDDVLATLDDGTPALISRRVEAGRVLIVNGSVDDRWCDLPRRKSFVPFIDRLLLHLQSAGIRRQFESGETIAIALPEPFDVAQPPRVKSPTGRIVNATLNKTSNRTWLSLSSADESGFYRIESPDGSAADVTFVVQPGRGDSRLEPFDAEKFRAWWSPVEIKVERAENSAANPRASDQRVAWEPWLVALACLLFVMEMFLAHWMCPRMNPALSTSHHRRRGFVAPLKEREEAVS